MPLLPGLPEIPLKIKLNGQELDLGPLVAKLLGGAGITLGDLLPLLVGYLAANASQPHPAPAPQPAPAPAPPAAVPPSAPAGEPLASLRISGMWIQRGEPNARHNDPFEPEKVGWGDKVAFDANGFDKAGQKRADLQHEPIVWHWQWDEAEGSYPGENDVPQINAGTAEYQAADSAAMVLKVFKQLADAKQHQLKVWASAVSGASKVVSNPIQMRVN